MLNQKSQALSLLVLFVLVLSTSSCRSQRESAASTNATPEQAFHSTPPFQTKEPERYRAKRTFSIVNPAGESTVTTNWIAREGQLRRDELELPDARRVVYLDLPGGRTVLIPGEKVYGELIEQLNSNPEDELESSPDRLLHIDPIRTSYQNLGSETINGRNTTKYRVIVNSQGAGTVSKTETFVWVDESLGMPIKSEATSSDGTKAIMELSEISTEVESQLFQIPDDYQKLEAKEVRRRLGLK